MTTWEHRRVWLLVGWALALGAVVYARLQHDWYQLRLAALDATAEEYLDLATQHVQAEGRLRDEVDRLRGDG